MELFEGRTTFNHQGRVIRGKLISQAPTKGRPGILFMGSSLGGHGQFRDIQREFAGREFATYAMTLPNPAGSGQSTENSSLAEWHQIAIEGYKHFIEMTGADIHRVAVYGRAWGAYPAIEIAEQIKARGLILDNPVAFPDEIVARKFGLRFDIDHCLLDWRDSEVFKLISNFGGAIYHLAISHDMNKQPMHSQMQDAFRAAIMGRGGRSEKISNPKDQITKTLDYMSKSI